jgi:cysteine desulfurase
MWLKSARYLDYNAGAGLNPIVQETLRELLGQKEFFAANPSSRHRHGQRMQHLLYKAGLQVAQSFGSQDPDHLLFTSSGTEANQTVIRSALAQGMTVLIGAGEHSASHDLLSEADSHHYPLREVRLLPTGQVDLGQIHNLLSEVQLSSGKEEELDANPVLLSLFWANNETGVLNDLEAIRATLSELRSRHPEREFYLHLDGAQVWGKLVLDLEASCADFVTFSSHKIGAPAGTGVIWSRVKNTDKSAHFKLKPLLIGTQSNGLRGGTENWMGIVATGVAAQAQTRETVESFQEHTGALRDRLEKRLRESGLPITIWGEGAPRVANTSRFSLDSFKTYENWVELLDLRGFAVSHGSACKAQVIEPSRILLKMGATREQALNSIRVSFGPDSEVSDADDLVAQLTELYHNKRKT